MTQLVSVGVGGAPANGDSILPSIADNGRYVVYSSTATNLVAGDTNAMEDVFLRDRLTGSTERISVDSGGNQANGPSIAYQRSVTPDGRYVVFASAANNLVPGDIGNHIDIFIRDRTLATTARVSLSSAGLEATGDSLWPAISADGRFVAFSSVANNLAGGDANGVADIFVRDRQLGTTERVSLSSGGGDVNGLSESPRISANGNLVAFRSQGSNLVAGDTNGVADIYLRDRVSGTNERISFTDVGTEFTANCSMFLDINAAGNYVTFSAPESSPTETIYLRDRSVPATYLLAQGNNFCTNAQLAGSGIYFASISAASNFFPPDTNGSTDVYVWDAINAVGGRVSVSTAGVQGNSANGLYGIGLTSDRRYVVFDSSSTNLVAGDTNGFIDVFIHDNDAAGFTSLCDPGVAGVHACPCGNAPSGPGRGCNNSAATGGASLTAAGGSYLSTDTLVFTTSGEKPTAFSTLWQGTGVNPAGVVFGQGVRCAAGTLKRLYNKSAVAGSITAPNFGAGDPTVSARSAAKGDVISAGESRYYFVSYRDPIVLGGCPVTSTFDATQTGRVTWSP